MRPTGGGAHCRTSTPVPDPDLLPFGDAMAKDNDLVFRIALLNTGGFPVNKSNTKSKIIEEKV
jgi:hypothetical protein